MRHGKPLALWGGLECTINRVGNHWKDQSVLSGHDQREGDIARFADLGIKALRYPVLWEKAAAQGSLAFADTALAGMRELGIRPILGLIHHGSGPPGTSLVDPGFAEGLAAHADAVAARYPWVADWTPVNEPLTTARFSCLYGIWYPHMMDEAACWLALLNQIDATRLSMRAIRRHNPAARLVQTEDLGRAESTPPMAAQAAYENSRRWLTWDLLAGMVIPGHALWDRLAGHGLADRLRAIAQDPCPADVIGINHYLSSSRYLSHEFRKHPGMSPAGDGGQCINIEAVRTVAEPAFFPEVLAEAHQRYGQVLAITECHNGCTREEQMRWFRQGWEAAQAARADGIAVEAVTAWSLLGSYDWNSLLTHDAGHYEPGVFDLRSDPPRPTAMGKLLSALAAGATLPHKTLVEAPGWWQRSARFLPGYGGAARRGSPDIAGSPILITGQSGTLARALAAACLHRGLPHVLVGRPGLQLDDPASITANLDTYKPWAVVNCAGIVCIDAAEADPQACLRVNGEAPGLLARLCAERGIGLAQISSDQVFPGDTGAPYSEGAETRALNAYGLAKAEAERLVIEGHPDAMIVRTAAFFSPHDPYNFAVHAIQQLASGEVFPAIGDQIISPTYVPDLVSALLDLLLDGERGVWHLANPGGLSWADFARELAIGHRLDPRAVRAVTGSELGQSAPRPQDVRLTSERGLLLPSLDRAIARFSDSFVADRLQPAS